MAWRGEAWPGKARSPMEDVMATKFDEKPEITAAIDAVWKIIPERGSVLRWSAIEHASGCIRYEGSWSTIVKKIRKRLRQERMQATWPETGIGLRLLTEKETVTLIPKERQKRMFRQAGRAIKEMETADPGKLNMTERRILASQLDRLRAERKSLRAAQRELLEASQTIPRRKPSVA